MTNKNKLLIVGAGGHGKVVADIAIKINRWKQIDFLDDESTKSSMGIKVIGGFNCIDKYVKDYDIFVAIGSNKIREDLQTQLENSRANIPTLIHPNAIIGEQVEIDIGTVIMAGAVINCCSKIGKSCIINTGATIDHDNLIEDFVHISPGVSIAGMVKVGKGTVLGINSTVINNLYITSGCIIGAGAVVVNNIDEAGTYVGIPAKKL